MNKSVNREGEAVWNILCYVIYRDLTYCVSLSIKTRIPLRSLSKTCSLFAFSGQLEGLSAHVVSPHRSRQSKPFRRQDHADPHHRRLRQVDAHPWLCVRIKWTNVKFSSNVKNGMVRRLIICGCNCKTRVKIIAPSILLPYPCFVHFNVNRLGTPSITSSIDFQHKLIVLFQNKTSILMQILRYVLNA